MLLKDKRIPSFIKLARQTFRGYKPQIVILTLLGFLSGLLEGIGINAVIPMLSFLVEGESGTDFISRTIRQAFDYAGLDFSLKYLLIFICCLFVLKALTMVLCSYIRVRIVSDYDKKMKGNLFRKVLAADWPYLLRQKVGYVSTIVLHEATSASQLLGSLGQIIILATSMLVYVVVAFNISSSITLLSLALGGVIFLAFKPLFYRTRIFAAERAKIRKKTVHHIDENIIGMKTIKAMSVEKSANEIADNYLERSKNLNVKTMFIQSLTNVLMQPISLIFICVVFAISFKAFDFNFPAFLVIVYLIQKIFTYMQSGQGRIRMINELIPHLENSLAFKEDCQKNQEKDEGADNFNFEKALEVKNVDFAYSSRKPVLTDLSFKVEKGEMVGLIGSSGAGKTTVVDLLLRFLKPNKGQILLDNENISEIKLEQWRKSIGYVSQDLFLVNDTIKNNIKFYEEKISNDKMIEAAKMANIYDFIQGLPKGFSTIVGEGGIMLSVGQRQRIILARVLARESQILILDEATSALDNESEILVQKAIKELKGRMTVLMIAHRLSTVLDSDRLLVLDKGKIIEQGRPQDLLADKTSYFYKVYNIRE